MRSSSSRGRNRRPSAARGTWRPRPTSPHGYSESAGKRRASLWLADQRYYKAYGGRVDGTVRQIEPRRVEEAEELPPNFDGGLLLDRKLLEEREVEVDKSVPVLDVAAGIAEMVGKGAMIAAEALLWRVYRPLACHGSAIVNIRRVT